MTYGERLKAWRTAHKVSQRAFGKQVNVSGAYIALLELNTTSNPSYAVAARIAHITGIWPDPPHNCHIGRRRPGEWSKQDV